tara:strand:- start:404 stop:697 length:294 start_codon:yes stop_codon:yes gene_type:complete
MSYDNDKLELEEYNTVKSLMRDVNYAIDDGALSQGSIWLYRTVINVVKIYLTRNMEDFLIGNRFSMFLQKINTIFTEDQWDEIVQDNIHIIQRYPFE